MFYLWVDDIRTPPDGCWHWAKSVHQAQLYFTRLGGLNGEQGVVSLDHDAGDYGPPDYIEFLNWCEEKAYTKNINFDNIFFHVHSMNVVGRKNMKAIIAHNYWKTYYIGCEKECVNI